MFILIFEEENSRQTRSRGNRTFPELFTSSLNVLQ